MKDIIPPIQEALLKPKQDGYKENTMRDIILRFMKTKDPEKTVNEFRGKYWIVSPQRSNISHTTDFLTEIKEYRGITMLKFCREGTVNSKFYKQWKIFLKVNVN